MAVDVISTKNAPAAVGPYSQAIKVGDFLFASGQIGINPATGKIVSDGLIASAVGKVTGQAVIDQADQVLKNIGAILAEAGLTYDDVVKTTVFLADIEHFGIVNEVYNNYFVNAPLPARSCVEVANLPKDALIEIEVIAYCGNK